MIKTCEHMKQFQCCLSNNAVAPEYWIRSDSILWPHCSIHIKIFNKIYCNCKIIAVLLYCMNKTCFKIKYHNINQWQKFINYHNNIICMKDNKNIYVSVYLWPFYFSIWKNYLLHTKSIISCIKFYNFTLHDNAKKLSSIL